VSLAASPASTICIAARIPASGITSLRGLVDLARRHTLVHALASGSSRLHSRFIISPLTIEDGQGCRLHRTLARVCFATCGIHRLAIDLELQLIFDEIARGSSSVKQRDLFMISTDLLYTR
jgi:hypothetical protein